MPETVLTIFANFPDFPLFSYFNAGLSKTV